MRPTRSPLLKLFTAAALTLPCSLAWPTNVVLDAYADHAGRLNGWLLLPEVVLKHCEIHVPAKTSAMRTAYSSWLTNNAQLISEARAAVLESAQVLAPMLNMTVEQAREWQRDSTTLIVEEVKFWRKGRMEVYGTCSNYEKMLGEHVGEPTQRAMRESLNEIERLKQGRR